MIEIKGLPFPPSLNTRFGYFNGRMILSKEHRAYKNDMTKFLLKNYKGLSGKDFVNENLLVEIDYCGPWETWFTKKNTIRKIDIDNRAKCALDLVFPYIGLDDSQIFELVLKKKVTSSEDVTMNIRITSYEI